MTLFEIIENLGICFGIYLGMTFFPWIFTIFVKQKPELSNNESLKENIALKPKKYSYHIDLSTKLFIHMEVNEELKRELEKRNILPIGSESKLLDEMKRFDEMINITNIRKLYASNNFLEVIKIIQKRIEIFPNEIESRIFLLRSYFLTKEYSECIKTSKEILKINESNLDAMRFIARSNTNLGNEDKALKNYLNLIKFYPNDLDSLTVITKFYYNLEEYEICIKFAKTVLDIDESNLDAMRFIARSYKNLDNLEFSTKYYLEIINRFPEDIDSSSMLIRNYYNINDYEKVLFYCEIVLKLEKTNKNALRFKARCSTKLDNFEEAILNWRKLIKIEEDNLEALIELGRNLHNIGEYNEALKYLEKGLELAPNDRRAIRTLALVYERTKNLSKALELYTLECNNYPNLASNWEKRINLLYHIYADDIEPKKCLNEIFRLLGDTLEGNLMALSVSISWYWDDEAREIVNKSEKKWGNDIEFHTSISENALEEGDLTRAYTHLIRSKELKITPKTIQIENRLMEMLNLTSTSIEYLKELHEKGETLLYMECIIKAISEQAKKVVKRTPNKDKLNVSIISSSLGRGGAERQVVACLNGLKNSDKVNKLELFCYGIDNTAGGLDTYAHEIREMDIKINEFAEQRNWNKGFEKELDTLKNWRELLNLLPKRFLRDIEPLYLFFKHNKPDIVHAWQDRMNINAGLAALMAGVPGIILFARSQRPDRKTKRNMRNKPYLKRAYNTLLTHPNIILCHNSNSGAESYREWLEPPNEINFPVIYNGTNFEGMILESSQGSIEEEFSLLKIPENSTIIGSVFRFVNEKEPFRWVDSLVKVCQNKPSVHGIIVGTGTLYKQVKKYIKKLGFEDRIHLPGQTRMVKAWMDKFDLFFLCSRVEGLPNVIIEAQGFGIPVVSTNAGGASETIIDGITGHIVYENNPQKLSQKLISVLNDKIWLENASIKAIDFSQKTFSTQSMLNRLLEIYNMPL
jgi:glycosyltransferase involved in cell wall biosynthesis